MEAASVSVLDPTAWVDEWGCLWNVPDLSRIARVTLSGRLRRSLGRCDPRSGEIRLHRGLAGAPVALQREVVCHEVAHVAAHRLHGARIRPHGPEWKRLMVLAGFEPRARLPLSDLPDGIAETSRPRVLYDHTCPVCGARRTALKRVTRWRCRACHEAGLAGRLVVTTRPANV
jgi:predicted SprT family Zn-dependent metalloprotease